jgi:hypothetical protein
MIVEESISDVICGGIEELHYNFLVWKKVKVLDGVIGDWKTALEKALVDKLHQGEILPDNNDEQQSL